MRKDKALPFRVAFTVFIVLLDIVVIPQFLLLPTYIKQGTINQFSFSAFGWITALSVTKSIWLWLQPMIVSIILWLWLTGRSMVNINYDSEVPQPAGHGQHGTARWQTPKEIDRNFKSHNF